MTVKDLIAWLQTKDPEAPVYIDDVHTGWLLPLQVARVRHEKAARIVVFGEYYDEGQIELEWNRD